MARYRVREGERLAHAGQVHEAGAIVEMPRPIAEDPAVRGAIDEVDEAGKVIAPRPPDELERFKSHERVSILRERLRAAQGVVDDLERQLAAEQQVLADAVKAAAAPKPATKKTTDAASSVRE